MVATALKEHLPSMLNTITCWMSESDLPKGKPWFTQLEKALNSIVFAIVCVTPENENAQWLLWESGFLSSASELGERHIVPLAIGRPKDSLRGPLSIYNAADTTFNDMQALVLQINEALPEAKKVNPDTVRKTFPFIWPVLEAKITAAISEKFEANPAPKPNAVEQQDEVLALLRQQQREGADLKELVVHLGNMLMSPAGALSGAAIYPSPDDVLRLSPDDLVRGRQGALSYLTPQFVGGNGALSALQSLDPAARAKIRQAVDVLDEAYKSLPNKEKDHSKNKKK